MPVHPDLGFVARLAPCFDRRVDFEFALDTVFRALAAEHAELDLRDVEPTPMFGGMDNFNPVGDPRGFCGLRSRTAN